MIDKCKVFTPNEIVNKLLDSIYYTENLYGKKILENSCGDGAILIEIVKRYVTSCRKQHFSDLKIKHGIEKDIIGVEIDKKCFNDCIENLNKTAHLLNIESIRWNIINEDALKLDTNIKFDYIVGNPPYINYRDMDNNMREYVKQNFSVCADGKVDYFYAFIQKSYESLSETGKMSYLIPNCVFKNVFAENVRELIKNDLIKIYDYTSKPLFNNILTSSAIIVIENNSNHEHLHYHDVVSNKKIELSKKSFGIKWIFKPNVSNKNNYRFNNYFKAMCSIATLNNSVFVLESKCETTDWIITKDGDKIEKGILKVAYSPRASVMGKKQYIIFPYKFNNDSLEKYTEEYLRNTFPFAYQYLLKNKESLIKRDSDKSAKWFEYGRSQAISHLYKNKLLISSVYTKKIKVYKLEKDEIPYSGIVIYSHGDLKLSKAQEILESNEFAKYIEDIGVDARSGSKRISPKDINEYTFNL